MNKRSLILFGLLLVGGGLAWLLIRWYTEREYHDQAFSEKDLAKAAARLHPGAPTQPTVLPEPPLDPSHRVRLAIGWLGLPDEARNGQVADLLTAELTGAKGLELVDRQSLGTVLRELELSLSGLVRAKDAVRVGKLLHAEWFLLGSTAPVGASNAVIARIVDARKGVMRDVGVFPYAGDSPGLAAKLADFVRRCRQPGNGSNPHVFLAVGTFQDLSVNSRQAALPAQLRTQLIEAYHGSGTTLLEREYVSALLQEVRLDLAGVTETSASSLPAMQSAFWLVDGYYQSYETSGFEVELGLNIRRIFGRQTIVVLRDKAGETLVKKIKAEIDKALSSHAATLVPTRVSEAKAQMAAGKELFLSKSGMGESAWLISGRQGYGDAQQAARSQRNLEEAVRAFETVLLLEPTNREAKLYLAAALRGSFGDREEQARQYYREILDEPINDKWVGVAQQALSSSLRWATADEKTKWLQPAAVQATNPSAEFFQRESRNAAMDAAIEGGEGPKIQELAEVRLFETIASFDAGRFYQESIGMDEFAKTFGQDRAAAARRLVELYPKMKAQTPASAPYLLATIVAFQVETNAPVVAEFANALDEWAAHPEKVPNRIGTFWNHIDIVYRWGQEHKFSALSTRIVEAKQRANGAKPGGENVGDDEDKMQLAFTYKASHRWQDALKVFESYTNQPVAMGGSGPWGPAFSVILPSREAAECRKQLGLPVVQDPREFDLGKSVLCLHGSGGSDLRLTKFGSFATAPDGLWIGIGGKLLQWDFNLKTNLVIALPVSSYTPITSICLTPTEIWIGTGGDGLVGYDLASHQCLHLTEKEGLLMGFISSLHLAGGTLWIGYGQQSDGGLGKLDLRTHRATSFTPSLTAGQSNGTKPPRVPVVSLASGAADDVWYAAGFDVGRYRSRDDQWDIAPDLQRAATLASVPDKLFVGTGPYGYFHSGQPTGLGLRTFSFKDEQWKTFPAITGLPSEHVTTLTVDGHNLWVGGKAYVALVDPVQAKILKFAYVRARSVDRIQVGGGCVWAQFDWHLYKAPLAATR